MTTSEEKYWIADKLYDRIKEDFYNIENEEVDNLDNLIDKTIENAEEALEIVEGINMKVIKKLYPNNIHILTRNVSKFREQADFVLTTLKRAKNDEYEHKRQALPPEMYDEESKKNWQEELKKQREEAKKSEDWNPKTYFDELGEGFVSFSTYIKNKK